MKLTELLVATAVFIMAAAVFTASFITVRRSILKSEAVSKSAVSLLETDEFLRKEIKCLDVPYWKNFNRELEGIKEKLFISCNEK